MPYRVQPTGRLGLGCAGASQPQGARAQAVGRECAISRLTGTELAEARAAKRDELPGICRSQKAPARATRYRHTTSDGRTYHLAVWQAVRHVFKRFFVAAAAWFSQALAMTRHCANSPSISNFPKDRGRRWPRELS